MQTVTKIEAIYDRDHGRENEGWYIRLHLSDGQERDAPQDWTRRTPSVRRVRAAAREEAMSWGFVVPRGVPVEIR
jgi:hypothetical protein